MAPGFVPVAFSNPVWVDVDGDGRFAPPGLPARETAGPGRTGAAALGGVLALALAAWLRRRRP